MTALAGGNVPFRGGSGGGIPFTSTHESVLQIKANEALPQRRAVVVGLNKTMMVEVPRELRDVIVSNPEFMDAVVQSSNRVYLIGKKVGNANVFFFDVNGEQIMILEIRVEPDTAPLDAMLRKLIPSSNIKTEVLNDTLILTGSVRSPIDGSRAVDLASRYAVNNPAGAERQKAKVINMLAVEGDDQVMLRVTVAEVQRSALKQLGINLGAHVTSGNLAMNILTENTFGTTAAAGGGALPIARTLLGGSAGIPSFANSTNSGAVGTYNAGPNTAITQAIRALERHGLVRTLAEPNLTAVSGETAKFLAGGEYPFPSVDGLGAVTVTFKEFGVGLAFTPVVLSEGRISIKVETEVSELDSTRGISVVGTTVPAIKKRSAKSTVEMASGASLALAGLISDDVRQSVDGLPGLKDVPVIGTLFRSQDFIRSETELVVIVTPFMVRPVARQKLGRPDDGLAPPSEVRANLMGHLNRVYGRGTVMPNGGLKGDYGFIVD
ncbi:MAG: type II and III secretion system protein family protein [Hyphomicrobiaceae bacterium]